MDKLKENLNLKEEVKQDSFMNIQDISCNIPKLKKSGKITQSRKD